MSKSRSTKSTPKKAAGIQVRPGKFFAANELFVQTSFLSRCKRAHQISKQLADRVFNEAVQSGHIAVKKQIGLYPGMDAYQVENMEAVILVVV